MTSRLALLAALPLLMMGSVSSAWAQPVSAEVCLSTNGKAQSLRAERKLREAREQLKVCSQPSCPSAVQRDCSQWLRDVEAALPTLSFAAKDANGSDLTKVRVLVDGHVLLEELDGSAIPLDPGKHSFTFEHEGAPSVTQELLVNEGDKARKIDVRFDGGKGKTDGAPEESGKPNASGGSKYSAVPFVLGGVGVAAMLGGFIFMANRNAAIPDECKEVSGKCTGVSEGDPKLAEAASLKNQSYVGLGIGVGGAVVLTGGVIWFIAETVATPKREDASRRLRPQITPVLGLGYAGIGGTF